MAEFKANIVDNDCGTFEDYTMPNEAVMQCGFATIIYGAYVFTLYRRKILMGSSMPIQDYYTLNYKVFSCLFLTKCILRVFIVIIPLGVCVTPFILYQKKLLQTNGIILNLEVCLVPI